MLTALIALPLLLAGCWDRMEIEDQGLVISLGVDKGDRSRYLITASMALVQAVGPMGQVKEPHPDLTEILTAEAETVSKAMYILNGATSRHLEFRHLRALTVGEELAREGLEPLMTELSRHPRVRGSVAFVVARGRAFDVLSANSPPAEVDPVKVEEGALLQAKRLHLSPPSRMHHFVSRISTQGIDPMVAAAAVNPWIKPGPQMPPGGGLQSATAGELARGGGNPVEQIGTAIFQRDRLAGFLNVDETQMLLALRGEMGKAYITFPDPDSPEDPVTMRFHQENLPKYVAVYRGGRPHVTVRILFEGEVVSTLGGTDFTKPEARRRLELAATRFADKTIGELLGKLSEWEADPVGFGLLFRGRAASLDAWEAYNWRGRVKDLTVVVETDMRVRRYGLLTGGGRVDGGR
ncbi:MAG TPA: Ger(x)C family spore germination protein [Symbiobacteriaceae bacterium]|nr:Ger(x)C family spore germination protein [Symbiobacteriaceae bacterium]